MRSPSYFRKKYVNYYVEFTVHSVQSRETTPTYITPKNLFSIARLDELPEADTSDLVRAYQYQRTIDENYLES